MGGDRAPRVVVEGAYVALQRNPLLHFKFFGDQDLIHPLLDRYSSLHRCSSIYHTTQVIANDTRPTAAIRYRKESSMGLAIEEVAKGKAQAVLSAGNTGAYMALSKLIFQCLEGIDRPALPAMIPTINGQALMLDSGANVECSAQNLIQFALMGKSLAQALLKIQNPKVGLLNVGAEEIKGRQNLQEAFYQLQQISDLNFYGFVEGDDIVLGTTDVVITDGFTGNVGLKAIEGTAKLIKHFLSDALNSSWKGKLGYLIAKPVFKSLRNRIDPRLYNGAVFLGLKHIAIKSHGGTDAIGFAQAIKVATDMVHYRICENIERGLLLCL